MKLGTAQLDISPPPGLELAGFAVRPQPSTALLDPLHARAIYLEDGSERVLWLHADLLAFEQPLADCFRRWAQKELGIPSSRVFLSGTHTHSAPAAIRLIGCGKVDSAFVAGLQEQLQRAACLALRATESCQMVHVQGTCALGQDRRRSASAHTDPRVGAWGWLRADGTFKAVALNYAMHPVCLRSTLISADWPGAAARLLNDQLPGNPLALVTVGACANINPPQVGVESDQMHQWGVQIAQSVLPKLLKAACHPRDTNHQSLRAATTIVDLPIETWDTLEIDKYADSCLLDPSGRGEFGDKFRLAVDTWRSTMKDGLRQGKSFSVQAELSVVVLGGSALLGVNAELFSRFTELVNAAVGFPVYTVTCTNGMIGYLPTAEAYDEGGYEVCWSMLFYNMPRVKKGGLELLAQNALRLLSG